MNSLITCKSINGLYCIKYPYLLPVKDLPFLLNIEELHKTALTPQDFHKIWVYPPKNMGLALKNMVKSLFDFTPEDFVKN